MERYNYYEAVRNDVKDYISEHYDKDALRDVYDWDRFKDELHDDMFADDSVTGNASGSYTFNAWEAEENLCHNLDLLSEAQSEFGVNGDILRDGPEACDVTIRCYILRQSIDEVVDEIQEEIESEDKYKTEDDD